MVCKVNSKGHDTTTPRSSLSHSQEDYDSTSSESGEDDGWESDEAESSNSSEEILGKISTIKLGAGCSFDNNE